MAAPYSYRWPGTSAANTIQKADLALLLTRAEEHLRQASVHGPDERSLRLQARIQILQGNYDKALALGKLARTFAPDSAEAHMELGIASAIRAEEDKRGLDYGYALESLLDAHRLRPDRASHYNLARVATAIPMPHLSAGLWRTLVDQERDSGWTTEVKRWQRKSEEQLARHRDSMAKLTTSSDSFLSAAIRPGTLEAVMTTAVEEWLVPAISAHDRRRLLKQLGGMMIEHHRDRWLLELVESMRPQQERGLQMLSDSVRANAIGEHERARAQAAEAEREFSKLGNVAGKSRARLETVYALDRQGRAGECLESLRGLRAESERRGHTWIAAQAWLEEITCLTQLRATDMVGRREEAYAAIERTRYEGLRLRALSFLTENVASGGNRLRLWNRGIEGVRAFWNGDVSPLRGYSFYFTMASSARNAGERLAAVALLKESIAILKESRYRNLEALLLSNLGNWQVEAGTALEAAATFEQMSKLREDSTPGRDAFGKQAEIVRADAESRSGHYEKALERLRLTAGNTAYPYLQLGLLERRRILPAMGRAVLAAGRMEEAQKFFENALQERTASLRTVGSRVQRNNARLEMDDSIRGLMEVQVRRGQPADALRVWESFRIHGLYNRDAALPVIPANAAMLVYTFLPGGLAGWCANGKEVTHKWLNSTAAVAAANRLGTLAADPDAPLAAVSREARALYRTLVEPFESQLSSGMTLLIHADPKTMGHIPWFTLEDASGNAIVERFAVSQLSGPSPVSTTGLEAFRRRALIVAEPWLGEETTRQYPPLADARREGRMLHDLLPGSELLEGRQATLSRVRALMAGKGLFHFAGHGISYGGFGALLLAGEDGSRPAVATAEDIAALDLRNVGLVVLAACSSGEGEATGTVNLDSLVRAFFEAGAERVVAARWNVSSRESAELMRALYGQLRAGKSAAHALRIAAAQLRRTRSHPFFWAAFQNFGSF